MLDWINNLTSEAMATLKVVATLVAAVIFLVSSAKGEWALARIIVSGVVAAVVVAIVWTIPVMASKVQTELKSAPAVGVTVPAAHSHIIVLP